MAETILEEAARGGAVPEEDQEDSPWGLYQIDYGPRWATLSPEKGMVLCFNLPAEYVAEEGGPTNESEPLIEVALVVTERKNIQDGSILITGRSLGTSDPKFTPKMSGMFNRRTSFVHLCQQAENCPHYDLAVFHAVEVWLYAGTSFFRSYVTTAGKKVLKQVLDGISGPVVEEAPPGAAEKATRGDVRGKGMGGGPKTAKVKDKATGGRKEDGKLDKAAELRDRLQAIQDKKFKRPDKDGVVDLD